MFGMGDLFRPYWSETDGPALGEGLRLDDIQQLVVETLLEDYGAAFREGVASIQAAMREMQQQAFAPPVGNDAEREQMRQAIRERFEAIRAEMDALRQQMGDQVDREQLRRMFRERAEALREEFGDMMPPMPDREDFQRMVGDMAEPMKQWMAKKAVLASNVLVDVQAQLTEAQAALWPDVDRKLRREKTLSLGQFSGESLDLVLLVEELQLNDQAAAAIAPVLDEYETSLDAALRTRNDQLARSQVELYEAIQKMDTKAGLNAVERQTRQHVAVRDVNLRYAEALAGTLPAEQAAALRKAVSERAFDRVYRPTQTQRLLTSARAVEGLDPAQVAAIDAIERSYVAELSMANARLEQIIRSSEAEVAIERAAQVAARFSGEDREEAADPIDEAFEKRGEIGQRYQDQLRSLLPQEQFEALARSARRGGRWGDRPGGPENPPAVQPGNAVDLNGDGTIDDEELSRALRAVEDGTLGQPANPAPPSN